MPLIASAEALTPFGSIVAAVEADGAGQLEAKIVATEPADLSLPDGPVIDACRRFEVTIVARSPVGIAASIGLHDLPAGLRFGPSSGEHLMAAEIADARGALVVATHDGGWLASRAAAHGLPPARLAGLDEDNIGSLVLCRDGGLLVRLPDLQHQDTVRLFFAAAWASAGRSAEPSTDAWFAAEAALPWNLPDPAVTACAGSPSRSRVDHVRAGKRT